MSYETAVHNSDGTITLQNVYRGLIDTVAADHAVDARVFGLTFALNGFTDKPHIYEKNPYTYAVHSHGRTTSGVFPDDAVAVSYDSQGRTDWPLRPHKVYVADERTELPINVYVGSKTVVNWQVRSRKNRKIAVFEEFATEIAEIMSDNRRQAHVVTPR